jgi:serine/threonine protein kinase
MTTDRDSIVAALPNYDIGGEIGRGAFGVVLVAEHRRLGRRVAVKELPRPLASDPAVRRRFATEARLLASLDHPHIVPVFDYVEKGGLCLLVMEYLSGGTVWERFRNDGIRADLACSLVLATCNALHFAHGKGILHRDIKPQNLLFSESGTLKVADFGIAKVLGGSATLATRTGEVLGTPAYMAPEQVLGEVLTPATDVYAVGTVLYALLSGRLPFPAADDVMSLLFQHVHNQPTPLQTVAPDVAPEIDAVVMRALATDPLDRYQDADDLAMALARAATSCWGAGWFGSSRSDVALPREATQHVFGTGTTPRASSSGDIGGTTPPSQTAATVIRWVGAPTTTPGVASPPTDWPDDPPPPPDAAGPDGGHGDTPSPTETVIDDLITVPQLLAEPAPPAPPRPPAPTPTRRRALIAGAAITVVVLAAAAILIVTSGSNGKPTKPGGPAGSTVAAPGRLVYSDNFADPASGWTPDAGQDGAGTGSYQDGGYQLTVLKPLPPLNTFSAGSPYRTKLTAMAVTATVSLRTGAPSDGGGVRCDQGSRSGLRYTFELHGDGTWTIFELDGQQTVLAQGTAARLTSGGSAVVTGECSEVAGGTRLTMSIDGSQVGTVINAHPGAPIPWHAALTAYRSAQSPGAAVRFNGFRTVALGG